MIVNFSPGAWGIFFIGVGNHLWQSTLFIFTIWLLTFVFRHHHAKTRYWLWFAASMKFLLPFYLLVLLGSHLTWLQRTAPMSDTSERMASSSLVMERMSQPFTLSASATPIAKPLGRSSIAARANALFSTDRSLPVILVSVWLCGFLSVMGRWFFRYSKIKAAIQNARPLRDGREVDALRRMEHLRALRRSIEVFCLPVSAEPGIFGLFHPILLWPRAMTARFDDAHLEAVLAHEISHVRRRDNLTAAMHMLVEAIFWFHPLVWWLEMRLVAERENACDEDVLLLLREPGIYAESILKVCKFSVESTLACVSGITGADLKKRIVQIMRGTAACKLGFGGKLLLLSAAFLATIAPVMLGLWHRPVAFAQTVQPDGQAQTAAEMEARAATDGKAPAFDVVSIKPHKAGDTYELATQTPDGYSVTNMPMKLIILNAYGIRMEDLVVGAPGWADSERFDIVGKMDAETIERFKKLSDKERGKQIDLMLQRALADRCGLKAHPGTKEVAAYALVVAKSGFKLKEADVHNTYADGIQGQKGPIGAGWITMGRGKLTGQGIPISLLAANLGSPIGSFVVDKTGINGEYDIALQWDPSPNSAADGASSAADNGPSLFTALQEQLGLKLIPAKVPMDTVVIEHVDRPSAN
jgi:bla regulator protein BlaR1